MTLILDILRGKVVNDSQLVTIYMSMISDTIKFQKFNFLPKFKCMNMTRIFLDMTNLD